MARDTTFVRSVLQDLQEQAESAAMRFSTLRHMLLLPTGERIRISGVVNPGGPTLRDRIHKGTLKTIEFGTSLVVPPLPDKRYWPTGCNPLCAQSVPASNATKASSEEPFRTHLFFGGNQAAVNELTSLAKQLFELRAEVSKAIYGEHPPGSGSVYFLDNRHVDRQELDSWLCTMHWWAWTWTESPIYTRPHAIHGQKAYPVSRTSDALKTNLSFSLIDRDVFTATSVTIQLFQRFITEPPPTFWDADYPDVPKAESMTERQVADLADRFVGYVTQYLQWDTASQITAITGQSKKGETPSEEWVKRLEDAALNRNEAAARIRRYGPALAAGIERFGLDSSPVLSIVHCAGTGGGGPDFIRPNWESMKVSTQQIAIRLRNNRVASRSTALAENRNDSNSPGSDKLERIAMKLESYANASTPVSLTEHAAQAGTLLFEARCAGAFDAIEWDDLDVCFRQFSPQSGAPLNEGRRLLQCVTTRLAKSHNPAAIKIGFSPEPKDPRKAYDVDWLRQTFRNLGDLIRSEISRIHVEDSPATVPPPISAAAEKTKSSTGLKWKQARRRMLGMLDAGTLPLSIRQASVVLKEHGFSYNTVNQAAHSSGQLSAHFKLKIESDSAPPPEAMPDELSTGLIAQLERLPSEAQEKIKQAWKTKSRKEAFELLKVLTEQSDRRLPGTVRLIENADSTVDDPAEDD